MNQETRFYFLSKTETYLPPNCFFIFFIYSLLLEKVVCKYLSNLLKYLTIFFRVLTSEIFEASFLFVVNLTFWSCYDGGLHQMKKIMANLKQNNKHNLVQR